MRMRRRGLLLTTLLVLCSTRAFAAGEPGRFDYWVLALSWSPEYCQSNLADEECRRPYHFVVHGLWPQYERGYPSSCGSRERVSRELMGRMLPLMPSEDLIQHEWNKHGTCSGLSQDAYFALVERVRRKIEIPAEYREPDDYIKTTLYDVEHAFMRDNRGLESDGIAVQCRGHYLREVRLCFDADLDFRACGRDVDDHCRSDVTLRPQR